MHQIVLVNEQDERIGLMDKLEAHQKALLHRAYSVFIFNNNGELLLQKRAENKYHSGGLWTNTCCSHPRPNETNIHGATRRLNEEMGFTVKLDKAFTFIYKAELDNGLTEHEFDHVLVGNYDGPVRPNADEVADWKYVNLDEIEKDLEATPEKYTVWFRIAFPKLLQWMRE